MIESLNIKIFLFSSVFFLLMTTSLFGQSGPVVDSSRFSANASVGWSLLNSYVAKRGTDSTELEVIIQHANNINWTQEQFIGTITYTLLLPHQSQVLVFEWASGNYRLRIDPSGRCYLTYLGGSPPINNPQTIPFKIVYKTD